MTSCVGRAAAVASCDQIKSLSGKVTLSVYLSVNQSLTYKLMSGWHSHLVPVTIYLDTFHCVLESSQADFGLASVEGYWGLFTYRIDT